jgi:lipoprotein signal peptidase
MTHKRMLWSLIALTLSLVGCDHGTKIAARAWLDEPVTFAHHIVELRCTENHDSAFSLTRALAIPDRPHTLAMIAALMLLVVAAMWWRRRGTASMLEHVGFACVVAGALGNVSDRLMRGYVVDFIYVRPWPFYFNVADILVVLGAAFLMLAPRVSPNATHST